MTLPYPDKPSSDYRYGFNGMEKDDELKGEGNSYDYDRRFYDPRIGKFLSRDPMFRDLPSLSPYCFAGNNPVLLVDYKGNCPIIPFLIKGAVGAVISAAMQFTINYVITGDDVKAFNEINWYQVGADGLQSANPFGMTLPGRTSSSTAYRYGFNGKEKDDELKGEGNHYDYGFRMHDSRVGRFLSVDPLAEKGPQYSPYNYCFNNPINLTDPDGRWPDPPFGFRLGFNFGLGSNGINFNVTASAGVEYSAQNFQAVAFASASVYGGQQLGTSSMTRGLQFDVTAGAYASVGNGTGSAHNFYTLNSNTPSPFNNTFDTSFTYGQARTFNSAINASGDGPGWQTQGIIGMRFGENFSVSSNNDAKFYGTSITNKYLFTDTGSDAGWTGGIVLNVAGVEAGYQNFSGYWAEFPDRPKGDWYTSGNREAGNGTYHQSLNRALNFVRTNQEGAVGTLGVFSGAWFQNLIHDIVSKDAKYIYNNQGNVNTTVGN